MPVFLFLRTCRRNKIPLSITRVFIPAEEQERMYRFGRSEDGPKITALRHSLHTDLLAFDCDVSATDIPAIDAIGDIYGIQRKICSGARHKLPSEPWHYELTHAQYPGSFLHYLLAFLLLF